MSSFFRAMTTRADPCDPPPDGKPASKQIQSQQRAMRNYLPFSDKKDFVNAQKGFKVRLEPNVIKDGNKTIWNNDAYAFLNPTSPDKPPAPDTANPSLWRQSKLNAIDGLFEVIPRVYQVRGLDISNVTIIEGDDGIIVIDPLTSKETAAAANKLYQDKYGPKEVKAMIYTHSHTDHYGGVKGFISQGDADKGKVKVIAPEGFMEHAVSENVYAGTAMSRRAGYMYGAALPRGPKGQIGAGLGQTVSAGTVTLVKPTDYITKTGQTMRVDGVDMVFQMAPNTEAPAEMLIFFPQLGALCAAEDAVHTFHNILTLRGALVRDPHQWSRVLTETIDMFGGKASVIFASHHWPTWGYSEVVDYLTLQRDLYAYVHDNTLRLLNKGLNGPEIAEELKLPPALDKAWNARGYYGSLNHNIKAIYQRYLGWFDGNPAHLWEHIPVERAIRYVKLAGGIEKIIDEGKRAYDGGDFRWAAEILNHGIFAQPDNVSVKNLLADTYEQLGYGAECGPWRDFFISGTTELRCGNFGTPTATNSPDVLSSLSPEMLMDAIAIQVDGNRAWRYKISIKIVLTDGDRYIWRLSHGALIYHKTGGDVDADVTLTATTRQLTAIAPGFKDLDKLKAAGIDISGDESALTRLNGLLEPGDPDFNIVTP